MKIGILFTCYKELSLCVSATLHFGFDITQMIGSTGMIQSIGVWEYVLPFWREGGTEWSDSLIFSRWHHCNATVDGLWGLVWWNNWSLHHMCSYFSLWIIRPLYPSQQITYVTATSCLPPRCVASTAPIVEGGVYFGRITEDGSMSVLTWTLPPKNYPCYS